MNAGGSRGAQRTRPGGPPRANNFDLLRLLAAVQVVLVHAYDHLHLAGRSRVFDAAITVLSHFPGVPIFFAASGFLLPWAFTRNPDLVTYARNRLLRVYPGLYGALVASVIVMAAFGILRPRQAFSLEFAGWLGAQLTAFQFYTPPMLRAYGVGNPNGALWTIVVELQFYICVPVIVRLAQRFARGRVALLAALWLSSLTANVILGLAGGETVASKLLRVTLAPYLFYFLTGTILFVEWDRLARFVRGRGMSAFAIYATYALVVSNLLGAYVPSYWPKSIWGVVAGAMLGWFALAAALSGADLSNRVLRGRDLSYGIYLHHMVVINLLVQAQFVSSAASVAAALLGTAALALASWQFVERPMLRRKRYVGAAALDGTLSPSAPSSKASGVDERS